MPPVNANSSYEEVEEWLFAVGCKEIVPRSDLTVSEWADANRIIARGAAEAGPWRTDKTPYLREIMDALSANSPYEEVVFMKGAQIGGTEAGLNWVGYAIDQNPGTVMILWPTEDDVKANVRIRLNPFFESTPCVGDKIGDAGLRDGANNTFLKEFPGGYLALAASNSSAKLRSKPARYLLADEVDEYPGNVNQNGDPIMLLKARSRTYIGRKIFELSTPTIAGASRIEEAFSTTDRRRFYVPCPFCGVYQVLIWGQMRHEKGRPDKAWYECIYCIGRLEEFHKFDMLARGEWRPEQESSHPKKIGFHLSALYAPPSMHTWSACMSEYHESLGNESKLQVWTNTTLGIPYEQKGERPEWEKLYYRREKYELGSLPEGVLILTAGIDVQVDRIEAEVVGWGRNKESWSVGYYVFDGKTDDVQSESWNGLRGLLSTGFHHPAAGIVMHIQRAAIDSGYATTIVYQFGREYEPSKVSVIKGLDSQAHPVGQGRHVDVTLPSGKRIRRGLKRFPVGVSTLKHELYGWLRLDRPEGGAPPPGYCHFPEHGEEYFKQLTAETYVRHESRTTRQQKGEWRKSRERNEALDCRIYARAAAAMLMIDMFKEPEWIRLELSLGVISAPPPEMPSTGAPAGPKARQERRRYRSRGFQE